MARWLRFMAGWVVLAGSAGAQLTVDGCYRVGEGSRAVVPELALVQLRVFSIERRGLEVEVRMGYRNVGAEPLVERLLVPTGEVRLEKVLAEQGVAAWRVEEGLLTPRVEGGLRPQVVRAGSVVFKLEEGADDSWLEGPLTLTVPPFLPLTFAVQPLRAMVPVAGTRGRQEVPFQLKPVVEAVAYFPLTVRSWEMDAEWLRVELESVNESRFPLQWTGTLSGKDLRVLTEEAELLEPVEVEGTLAGGLAPLGVVWEAGVRHRGVVRFRRPHPHASHALTLLMPGYEPTSLLWSGAGEEWSVVLRGAAWGGPTGVDPGVAKRLAEEERFASLERFWAEQGRRLQARDQAGYLAGFSLETGAREREAQGLAGLVRVPISWTEFSVPPLQALMGDELEVTGLRVELKCLLSGLPRENEFVTSLRCDLRRETREDEWVVMRCEVEGRLPFWRVGFTEVLSTDHFLVFYQLAAEEGLGRAKSAARQLEKGWERLKKTPLPLGERYAAFVVPEKADFHALTGRDPGTFSGAMSAAYVMRAGELRAVNQALFLNDSRFTSLQRFWGSRDRQQTIEHELVHLALAQQTRPWTPAWLVEGTAMVFAGQLDSFSKEYLKRQLPTGRVLAHLSKPPNLGEGAGSAEEVIMQYHYSGWAAQLIRERYDEATLLALYGDFAKMQPERWQRLRPGMLAEEGAAEEAMRQARLELAEELVPERLGGVTLDQIDATLRLEMLK